MVDARQVIGSTQPGPQVPTPDRQARSPEPAMESPIPDRPAYEGQRLT